MNNPNLTTCIECGHSPVSRSAKACPSCGEDPTAMTCVICDQNTKKKGDRVYAKEFKTKEHTYLYKNNDPDETNIYGEAKSIIFGSRPIKTKEVEELFERSEYQYFDSITRNYRHLIYYHRDCVHEIDDMQGVCHACKNPISFKLEDYFKKDEAQSCRLCGEVISYETCHHCALPVLSECLSYVDELPMHEVCARLERKYKKQQEILLKREEEERNQREILLKQEEEKRKQQDQKRKQQEEELQQQERARKQEKEKTRLAEQRQQERIARQEKARQDMNSLLTNLGLLCAFAAFFHLNLPSNSFAFYFFITLGITYFNSEVTPTTLFFKYFNFSFWSCMFGVFIFIVSSLGVLFISLGAYVNYGDPGESLFLPLYFNVFSVLIYFFFGYSFLRYLKNLFVVGRNLI